MAVSTHLARLTTNRDHHHERERDGEERGVGLVSLPSCPCLLKCVAVGKDSNGTVTVNGTQVGAWTPQTVTTACDGSTSRSFMPNSLSTDPDLVCDPTTAIITTTPPPHPTHHNARM